MPAPMASVRMVVCVVGVLGCAPPGVSTEAGARRCLAVRTLSIPQSWRDGIDVLLVVADTPSMAPALPEMARRWPTLLQPFVEVAALGNPLNLHVGVVTSDGDGRLQPLGAGARPGCRGPVGSSYLRHRWRAGVRTEANLPDGQGLLDTFACMAQVGAAGSAEPHLLDAAYRAIHLPAAEDSGFLRDEAGLVVVLVTSEDDVAAADRSPAAAVARWQEFFTTPAHLGGAKANPLDVVVVTIDGRRAGCTDPATSLAATPAPRLESIAETVAQHRMVSFCDPEGWGAALEVSARTVVSNLGGGCIPYPLVFDPAGPGGLLSQVVAEDVTVRDDWSVSDTPMPRCDGTGRLPCFRVEALDVCKTLSPDGVGITVDRGGQDPPPHTTLRVTYAARCPPPGA